MTNEALLFELLAGLFFSLFILGGLVILTSALTELVAISLLRIHRLEPGLAGGALAFWMTQILGGTLGAILMGLGYTPAGGILLTIAAFAVVLTYVLTLMALIEARGFLAQRLAAHVADPSPEPQPKPIPRLGEGPYRHPPS